MNKPLTAFAVLVLAACSSSGAPAPAPAPTGGAAAAETAAEQAPPAATAVASASFSEEQADRGRDVFRATCTECHYSSEFSDSQFKFKWSRRSAGNLYELIQTSMPETAPGSLSPDEAVDIVLKPGQMSLHHGRIFHASGPNRSGDRRIGVAIRYMTPGVHRLVGESDYAMLARGCDRERNWINFAAPREDFAPADLAFYEQVLAERARALAAGADESVTMYETDQRVLPV